MKVQLNKLIPNKFYCCYVKHGDVYYFKYSRHNNEYIFGYYYLYKETGYDHYNYAKHTGSLFSIKYYDVCDVFKEVDIEELLTYLPNDNVDKKNYIRREKIESLLNLC